MQEAKFGTGTAHGIGGNTLHSVWWLADCVFAGVLHTKRMRTLMKCTCARFWLSCGMDRVSAGVLLTKHDNKCTGARSCSCFCVMNRVCCGLCVCRRSAHKT